MTLQKEVGCGLNLQAKCAQRSYAASRFKYLPDFWMRSTFNSTSDS